MAVTVEFNPDTYQEFFADILADYPDLLENLRQDFTDYIESDGLVLPNYFGKDTPYMQPPKAIDVELMHIHILMPPSEFPANKPQFDRKCPMNAPHQDAALVYTRGIADDSKYSLIALLHPNAHGMASDRKTMNYLIAIADKFQESLW